jgi:undecaprenyl-diphosphatase
MKAPSFPTENSKVSKYSAFLREIKALHFIAILTLILFAMALLVHAFGVLEFDVRATQIVQSLRSPLLDKVAEAITMLGNGETLVVVAFLAALYFWAMKLPQASLFCIISLLAYPINVGIKELVDRARPTSSLVYIISPTGGYSFPSGHAMITMASYGLIAYLLWTHIKSPKRWLIPPLTGIIVLLVGLSRVYLGVHWFSDVLGGWIAGIILMLILAEAHKMWEKHRPV